LKAGREEKWVNIDDVVKMETPLPAANAEDM
jgi:hypothetical protein